MCSYSVFIEHCARTYYIQPPHILTHESMHTTHPHQAPQHTTHLSFALLTLPPNFPTHLHPIHFEFEYLHTHIQRHKHPFIPPSPQPSLHTSMGFTPSALSVAVAYFLMIVSAVGRRISAGHDIHSTSAGIWKIGYSGYGLTFLLPFTATP